MARSVMGAGSSGPGNWAVSTARPHGGSNAFLAQDYAALSDQRLISPAITLPTGQDPLALIFWNDQTMESQSSTACYDGSILEISTDSGATFTQVAGAALLTQPYKGPK